MADYEQFYEKFSSYRHCAACDFTWYGPQKCEMCGAQGCKEGITRVTSTPMMQNPATWRAVVNG